MLVSQICEQLFADFRTVGSSPFLFTTKLVILNVTCCDFKTSRFSAPITVTKNNKPLLHLTFISEAIKKRSLEVYFAHSQKSLPCLWCKNCEKVYMCGVSAIPSVLRWLICIKRLETLKKEKKVAQYKVKLSTAHLSILDFSRNLYECAHGGSPMVSASAWYI